MKLALLGCGKMGSALLKGILHKGHVLPAHVTLSDPHTPSATALAAQLPGTHIAPTNLAAATGADVVLLCVKPPDIPTRLAELLPLPETLLISIAAGVTLPKMETILQGRHRLIRVMPNTPALIGHGASAYALGTTATEADATLLHTLLTATGTAHRLPEKLLDAVTGLSGSGPAYVYTIIEALSDGGLLMGLSKEQSLHLAAQTVAGAAAMVLQTGQHPALLRDQVTSPGGTTIAGLAALEAHGLRHALISAVQAATLRAKELG